MSRIGTVSEIFVLVLFAGRRHGITKQLKLARSTRNPSAATVYLVKIFDVIYLCWTFLSLVCALGGRLEFTKVFCARRSNRGCRDRNSFFQLLEFAIRYSITYHHFCVPSKFVKKFPLRNQFNFKTRKFAKARFKPCHKPISPFLYHFGRYPTLTTPIVANER